MENYRVSKESAGIAQELKGKSSLRDLTLPEGPTPVPAPHTYLPSLFYPLPSSTGSGGQSKRSLGLREKLVDTITEPHFRPK